MDAEEIGRLISELENRVERLRSLYEQYFMGIERIEPLTLRKDVDRRLWALRREQIRNTGLRFKLETTIQRYNTYQQYWQRIVREIEAGTYQRDIGRAAQRFGDNVVTAFARRRQKLYEKGVEKKAEREALRRTGAGATDQNPPNEAVEDGPPSSNEMYDVTFEDPEAAKSAAVPIQQVASPEPYEPLELEISEPAPPPPPRAPAAAARIAGGMPPAGQNRAAPAPAAAARPAATPPQRPAPPAPTPHGAAPVGSPPYAAPPGGPVVAKPALPKPGGPPPYAAPPGGRSGAGTPAAAAAPKPAVPAARPPAPSRPDAPGPAVLGEDNNLSPIRMRQIYGAFVEAKRKANESTAAVTYEKIASNLENVAKELRAKHNARSVDFEVVMKNGKPVLKPVVKG